MSGFVSPKSSAQRAAQSQAAAALINLQDLSNHSATERSHGNPTESKSAPVESWVHAVAGGAGSLTAATFTMPLDVLKTRLQSDFYKNHIHASRLSAGISTTHLSPASSALLHFRETFQILFAIPKVEGWRALFKGLGPNLSANVPSRAIQFYVYGNGKRILSKYATRGEQAAWVHLTAAACAGVVTSTAVNPIHVVKTRIQLDKNVAEKTGDAMKRQYKNSIDCIKQILQKEGIPGLYRGLTASYLGVTELVVQWGLYEQMKMYLRRREEKIVLSGRPKSIWDQTIEWTGNVGAAGTAKLFAAIITYPHEVLRTRLRQAPTANGAPKYTNIVQCFKLVLKEEGLASMYGGLTPHLLRTVPSSAIMFGMYEYIVRILGV